jgi:L-iditol 2-dehydrogenase
MRAAVQTRVGEMSIRDVERPSAGPGEVVVRVRSALTCGTDRKILDRGHVKFTPPLVMGHEFSGDVAEAGPGAGFDVGEAVASGVSGPCGTCEACASGAANRCESPERDLAWGAFAEYVRVPRGVVRTNLFRKPPGLSYDAAAALDPLACVLHGWSRLASPVEDLLVLGTGAIGLLWIAVARAKGVRRICAVGRGAERLALAARWGAIATDTNGAAAPRASTVVECVGAPEAWKQAFESVRPGGEVLYFGGCAPGSVVELDAAKIHYGEVRVGGSFHYGHEDAAAALALLESGEIDAAALVSGSGTLADLPLFFERMRRSEGIKYAVRP